MRAMAHVPHPQRLIGGHRAQVIDQGADGRKARRVYVRATREAEVRIVRQPSAVRVLPLHHDRHGLQPVRAHHLLRHVVLTYRVLEGEEQLVPAPHTVHTHQ